MTTCVELISLNDDRWLDFAQSAGPSLFQSPRWCQLIAEEYGFSAHVAAAFGPNGGIIAGLPFTEVDDFRGRRRVAYAFSDVCEPLGDQAAWPDIEAALCAAHIPWQIRSRVQPQAGAEAVESPGVHQSVILPATMAAAAARFHQKQRVNAQRIERAGGTCRKIADRGFLDPFYALFATLRKKKFRLLPQSRGFFERLIAAYFPERGFGLLAELDGAPLAAMIVLAEGDTLYVKYSASDNDRLDLRPTNYLFREAIAEAIAQNRARLDLGISIEPGLQRFKRHLGAVSVPYFTARYGHQSQAPWASELERVLSRITEAVTAPDVPLSAAIDVGEVLYRYFV